MRIFAISTSSSHPAVAVVFPLWDRQHTDISLEIALALPYHMISELSQHLPQAAISVSGHMWNAVSDFPVPEEVLVDFARAGTGNFLRVREANQAAEFQPLHSRVCVQPKYEDGTPVVVMPLQGYPLFLYAAVRRLDVLSQMFWRVAVTVPSKYGWNDIMFVSWNITHAVVYSGLQEDGGECAYPVRSVRRLMLDVFGDTNRLNVVRSDITVGFLVWMIRGSATVALYPNFLTHENYEPDKRDEEEIRNLVNRLVMRAHAMGIHIDDSQILIV